MARVIYPDAPQEWKDLVDAIVAKNSSMGPTSPLLPYINENGNVLPFAANAFGGAVVNYDLFLTASRSSETKTAAYHLLWDPVFLTFIRVVQHLKSIYVNNPRNLGDWKIEVNHKSAVVYPSDFRGKQKLIVDFVAKHNSYPAGTSPIEPYLTENQIVIGNFVTDSVAAKTLFEDSHQLKRDKEKFHAVYAKETREAESETIKVIQYLKKFYSSNPQILGDWGIDVDSSPQQPVTRKGKIMPDARKTVNGVVVGGLFVNTGTTSLKLQGGRKGDGDIFIIEPAQQWIVRKGFSAFVMTNLSSSDKGAYSVEKSS